MQKYGISKVDYLTDKIMFYLNSIHFTRVRKNSKRVLKFEGH